MHKQCNSFLGRTIVGITVFVMLVQRLECLSSDFPLFEPSARCWCKKSLESELPCSKLANVKAKRVAHDELKGQIFLVLAACIVGFDLCLIFARQWRWLFVAPIVLLLVTLSMLYPMHRRQQKSRDALLSKISKLGEEMEAERKQYAEGSPTKNRPSHLSPPAGCDPSLN